MLKLKTAKQMKAIGFEFNSGEQAWKMLNSKPTVMVLIGSLLNALLVVQISPKEKTLKAIALTFQKKEQSVVRPGQCTYFEIVGAMCSR